MLEGSSLTIDDGGGGEGTGEGGGGLATGGGCMLNTRSLAHNHQSFAHISKHALHLCTRTELQAVPANHCKVCFLSL